MTEIGFEFCDGKDASDTNTNGPQLKHYRNTSLDQIYKNKESTRNDIIQDVELPTPYIKLYSDDGKFQEIWLQYSPWGGYGHRLVSKMKMHLSTNKKKITPGNRKDHKMLS